MFKVVALASVVTCQMLLGPTLASERLSRPPGVLDHARQDIHERNAVHAGDADGYTRAQWAREVAITRDLIGSSDKLIADPNRQRELYQNAIDRAKASTRVDPWLGGWADTTARAVGVGALAATEALLLFKRDTLKVEMIGSAIIGMTGVALDQGLTKFLTGVDKRIADARAASLTPQQVMFYNDWVDTVFLPSPEGRVFVSDFQIGAYKTEAGQDPAVLALHGYATRRDLSEMGSSLLQTPAAPKAETKPMPKAGRAKASTKPNGPRPAAAPVPPPTVYAPAGPMMIETLSRLEKVSAYVDRENERERLALKRDYFTGPAQSAMAIALLAGDEKTAQVAASVAGLSGAVFDISTQSAKMFEAAPFAYVNVYLFAATTALQLIQTLQAGQHQDGMLVALRQISTQIENLRKEMHERFDRLELAQARYFYETSLDLEKIDASLATLRLASENLRSEVETVNANVGIKFEDATRNELMDANARCLGTGRRGPLGFSDDHSANVCLNTYLRLADGRYANLITASEGGAERTMFDGVVARFGPGRSDLLGFDADQFKFGALWFAEAMKRNPKFRGIGANATWVDDRRNLNLSGVIARAEAIRAFQETMLVEPQSGVPTLKTDVLHALVGEYRQKAHALGADGAKVYKAALREWPDPATKWEDTPPPASTANNSPFASEHVTLCSVPATTVTLKQRIDRGRDFGKNKEQRARRIQSFDPNEMALNARFLNLLPSSLRWADMLNVQALRSFKMTACLSRAEITRMALYRPAQRDSDEGASRLEIHMSLDINVDYETSGGVKQHLLVGRLESTPGEITVPYFDPAFGHGLIAMAWSGSTANNERGVEQSIMHHREIVNGKPVDTYGMAKLPEVFFRDVDTPEISANLKVFREDFGMSLEQRKPELHRVVDEATHGDARELDAIRAQILYIVRRGLDLTDDQAAALYTRMMDRALPSGAALAWAAVEMGPTRTLDRLDAELHTLDLDVDALARSGNARPAASPLTPYIELLESFKR